MTIDEEIQGHFRNAFHRGLINLVYTSRSLNYSFLQCLKEHGLTEPQYNVLRILRGFRKEAPLSIGFIKERMLDKDSDVSRLVDRLFEKGYVSRVENPTDRRQKAVAITEAGLQLLSEMLGCERRIDSMLSNLSLEEVTELNRLLDKIRG
ncbi:MAG: MarR family transcriptional regulator [Bacteroidales bacterium]|nr:MarR family transcriptional regulator [Bacteroidales bacterium]